DLEKRVAQQLQLVLDVLRPLAFASGHGIPHESFWADVATRIAQRTITNKQIDEVKRTAGFYIRPDIEDEIGVYRLYHESFAEYLREGLDAHSVHAAFVASLRGGVQGGATERSKWELARPYALRHLARHAAESGQLAQQIDDPAFLVYAAPTELAAWLSRSQQ